jgi:hypothetical protein
VVEVSHYYFAYPGFIDRGGEGTRQRNRIRSAGNGAHDASAGV